MLVEVGTQGGSMFDSMKILSQCDLTLRRPPSDPCRFSVCARRMAAERGDHYATKV